LSEEAILSSEDNGHLSSGWGSAPNPAGEAYRLQRSLGTLSGREEVIYLDYFVITVKTPLSTLFLATATSFSRSWVPSNPILRHRSSVRRSHNARDAATAERWITVAGGWRRRRPLRRQRERRLERESRRRIDSEWTTAKHRQRRPVSQ